jgi:hypothetical protein
MTNGNQDVTSVIIEEKTKHLYKGKAIVNNCIVYFYYDFKNDRFHSSSLLDSEIHKFGLNGIHNWKYLICGSIAHCIKNNININ